MYARACMCVCYYIFSAFNPFPRKVQQNVAKWMSVSPAERVLKRSAFYLSSFLPCTRDKLRTSWSQTVQLFS